jgi:hypothetical protein
MRNVTFLVVGEHQLPKQWLKGKPVVSRKRIQCDGERYMVKVETYRGITVQTIAPEDSRRYWKANLARK